MSANQPDLSDTIVEFIANFRRHSTSQFYNYDLHVLVCTPNGEDAEDDRVLLVKADPNSAVSTTWRLPQIEDLADRPGSTGFQDSLKWIAFTYARDIVTYQQRNGHRDLPFHPFLGVTRIAKTFDEQKGVYTDGESTLKIYILVGYDHPQRITIDQRGDGFGLVSMAWLRKHREAFGGSRHDFAYLESGMKSYRRARMTPVRNPLVGGPRTRLPSNPPRMVEDEGYVFGY